MAYKAAHKPNQLHYGSAPNVVIVTGWTSVEYVKKQVDISLYSVIGPLFNPGRGLAFLLRNLLENGDIKYVVALTGTDRDKNAGSVEALRCFFERGVSPHEISGVPYWRVETDTAEGLIDTNIPLEALEILRSAITYREFLYRDIPAMVAYLQGLPDDLGGRTPKTYQLPQVETKVFPGYTTGQVVHGSTIGDAWIQLLHRIRTLGVLRPTGYDGQWQEILNLLTIVEGETLSEELDKYLPMTLKDAEVYAPYITQATEVEPGGKYTYGDRLRSHFGVDQIKQVIDKLVREIDSASGTMNLWDPEDHKRGGSPCLVNLWARVQGSKFTLTAVFRSNDMFGAWPLNISGLIHLQKLMLEALQNQGYEGLTLGAVTTLSESAHIYDDCFTYVDTLLADKWPLKGCYGDPVGNFTIEIENSEIKIEQWTPGSCGQLVKSYQGKSARRVGGAVLRDNPTIEPAHALYLGRELQKAEQALNSGRDYTQK